jgi:hypothetical protein
METPPALTPLQVSCIAFGAVVLGHALQIRDGFYDPMALRWTLLAAACVLAGAARLGGRSRPRATEGVVAGVLIAGLLSNLVALATMPIGMYLVRPDPSRHADFLAGLAAAALCTLLMAMDPARCRRAWMPALLATYGALGVWLIHASPHPRIDVITVFNEALAALGRFESPYSITFPNIYDNEALYGAGLVVNGRVQFGFPYPPLSLLMAIPAYVAGTDIRYTELTALLAGAAAVGYSVRGRIAPLAAAGLLFTPRTFFVLEQAWTESFVICWAGLTVFAATRAASRPEAAGGWPRSRGVALGLLVAVKQHLIIALLLARWLRRRDESRGTTLSILLVACATAALVTIPFFLWDPAGAWRSVVVLQLREPFRADSLSVLSYFVREGWQPKNGVLLLAPVAALATGVGLTWWRLPRTPAGFAIGLGASFLLLFLFSKKAFCNYYFLVIALLMAGVASASAEFSQVEKHAAPAERSPTGG